MPRNSCSCLSIKSNLVGAIKNSNSVKECLEYLGLRPAGGNYQQFYKWCTYYELTPPEGDCTVGFRRVGRKKQIPLEEILVTGSTYHRGNLKTRLLQAGLLKNQCSQCGQQPEWNNKPLTLQLDHINGVANDHRLSNLRLLCPNCHSQTQNFAGKKHRKHSKYLACSQCHQKLGRHYKQSLCRSCLSKQPRPSMRKGNRPPLNILRQQVQQQGYKATGRTYGVSDNPIRKWLAHSGM